MLMLAVQTMQAIMKDVRMREQAGVIQREVGMLMPDVSRLSERVLDFQNHFGLLGGDVEKILTSTDKIASRGRKIEDLEFEQPAAPIPPAKAMAPWSRDAASGVKKAPRCFGEGGHVSATPSLVRLRFAMSSTKPDGVQDDPDAALRAGIESDRRVSVPSSRVWHQ